MTAAVHEILDTLLGDMLELLEAEEEEEEHSESESESDKDEPEEPEEGEEVEEEQLQLNAEKQRQRRSRFKAEEMISEREVLAFLTRKGFSSSLLDSFKQESKSKSLNAPTPSPSTGRLQQVVKQANLWTQGKAQIQRIVNTCTGIVAQQGQGQEPLTVERGISPLPIVEDTSAAPTPKPISIDTSASTDDLLPSSPAPITPAENGATDTLKAQKAELVAKLSKALHSKHLSFTASAVSHTSSLPNGLLNGTIAHNAPKENGHAEGVASTLAEPRTAPLDSQRKSTQSAQSGAPITSSSASIDNHSSNGSTSGKNTSDTATINNAGKGKGIKKSEKSSGMYKTTMDDFLDMDMEFEGLPAPGPEMDGGDASMEGIGHHGLTQPLTSGSASASSSERPARTALEAKMQELRGRVAELSSRPTAAAEPSKKDEGRLNTTSAVGNSSGAASSTEEGEVASLPEPPSTSGRPVQPDNSASAAAAGSNVDPGSSTTTSAQQDSSTSNAAPSTTATASDTRDPRPAPTQDPRRRLPLPASALKSMFVTRPSKSSSTSVPIDGLDPSPAAAAGIPQVQPFSSRPVPLGNKEQKGIDRERAAAIHESARRESEAQRAAAAVLGSEGAMQEQRVSLPLEQTEDRDEEPGSEDSAMHDLFSGDDDDDDGDKGAAESRAPRDSDEGETPERLSSSAAQEQEARERELRNRLLKKRVREDEAPSGRSAASPPTALSAATAAPAPDAADVPAPVFAAASAGQQKKRRIIDDEEEDDAALLASRAEAAQPVSVPSIYPPPTSESQRSSAPSSHRSTPGGGRRRTDSRKLIPVVEITTSRRSSIVARKTTGGSKKKPSASTSTSADAAPDGASSGGVPAGSGSAERTAPPASPSGIKLKLKMSSSAPSTLPGTAAVPSEEGKKADGGEVTRRSVVQEDQGEEMQDASQSRDLEKSLFTPSPTPEREREQAVLSAEQSNDNDRTSALVSAAASSASGATAAPSTTAAQTPSPAATGQGQGQVEAASPQPPPVPTITRQPPTSSAASSAPAPGKTSKGKPKAAIPAGSKVIEITDSSDNAASSDDEDDEDAPLKRKPSSSSSSKAAMAARKGKGKAVVEEGSDSSDELPDLPFSQAAKAKAAKAKVAAAEKASSEADNTLRPPSAQIARKGVRKNQNSPSLSSSQPAAVAPRASTSKSTSPLPASSASQPTTTTRRTVEMQKADEDDFFRRDIENAWKRGAQRSTVASSAVVAAVGPSASSSSASTPTQSQSRGTRLVPAATQAGSMRTNATAIPSVPSQSLPSSKRKEKQKAADNRLDPPPTSAEDADDDVPAMDAQAVSAEVEAPPSKQSSNARASLPQRPSAETIAAAPLRIPGLPAKPSAETRIAGLRADSSTRPTSSSQLAAGPSRGNSPVATSMIVDQAKSASPPLDREASPPFQAGSPPASFDWLLSPPPESAPPATLSNLPNGTADVERDERIASSQTPEPQQLTDAEMDLDEVPAIRPVGNGVHSSAFEEMEIDELEEDAEGEPVTPEPVSPVPSSPPSTVRGDTKTRRTEMDRAADALLEHISQSLLDTIDKQPNGETEPDQTLSGEPGSASRDSEDAEEVQAQLLPARAKPQQAKEQVDSAEPPEAGVSPQKKGARMTASDFMASSTKSMDGIATPTSSFAVLPGDLQSSRQQQSSPNSIHAPSEADSVEFIVASQTTSFPSFSASRPASTSEQEATVTPASIDQIDRPLSDSAAGTTSPSFTRCRFGVTCINVNCKFAHPSPSAGKERNGHFPRSGETCLAGVACRDPICPKIHPSPAQRRNDLCRDQENCPYGVKCIYRHVPQPTKRAYASHNQSAVFNNAGPLPSTTLDVPSTSSSTIVASPSLSRSNSSGKTATLANTSGPAFLSPAAQAMLMSMQSQPTAMQMQAYQQQLQLRYQQQQQQLQQTYWQNTGALGQSNSDSMHNSTGGQNEQQHNGFDINDYLQDGI